MDYTKAAFGWGAVLLVVVVIGSALAFGSDDDDYSPGGGSTNSNWSDTKREAGIPEEPAECERAVRDFDNDYVSVFPDEGSLSDSSISDFCNP